MSNQDIFGLPQNSLCNIQEYKTANLGSWQLWQKPRGCTMAFMIAIGSGGGGAGQSSGVSSGSGGGASGAVARLIAPLIFLPEQLYIQVGTGGALGTNTSNGGNGAISYIVLGGNNIGPTTGNASVTVLQSGAAAATGGIRTATSTGGGGGTAETISTDALCAFGANIGFTKYVAGQSGGAGGGGTTPSPGTNVTYSGTLPITGGAGGGGMNGGGAAGGDITGAGLMQTIKGGVAGVLNTSPGGNGSCFQGQRFPFLFSGGSGGGGGGAAGANIAGNGGGAGNGCGGGGGGGNLSGAAASSGGPGGDGYVCIICW